MKAAEDSHLDYLPQVLATGTQRVWASTSKAMHGLRSIQQRLHAPVANMYRGLAANAAVPVEPPQLLG